MDLNLSPELSSLRDVVCNMFSRLSSLERVRAAEDGGYDAELMDAGLKLGLVELAVPGTDSDGVALQAAGVVAEEAGKHLASMPLLDQQVTARIVAASGHSAEAFLPADKVVLSDAYPLGADDWYLPYGQIADVLVIYVDEALHAVAAAEVSVTQVRRNLGSRAGAVWTGVRQAARRNPPLETGATAAALVTRARSERLALASMALVGMGSGALDLAAKYASERQQFGRPIGSFQGVAHPLADSFADLTGARLLSQKAVWSLDVGATNGSRLACMAYAAASSTAQRACETSLHVHGGYGFTLEFDVQLFLRRAKALTLELGSPVNVVEELAELAISAGTWR
jgi:hypothetical protein